MRIKVTSTEDSGKGSLREAIASAQNGDMITFASSLAGKTITLTSGQLEIPPGKSLTINGGNAPGLTISGNKASRAFFVNSNQDFPTRLILKNLAVNDTYTSERGGGVFVTHKGEIRVRNVDFTNNVADKGGGAIFTEWETTLRSIDSTFDSNKGTGANDERGAGAIGFLSPGPIWIKNSKFSNNHGINGAAINSLQGKLTIEDSIFSNNTTAAGSYDTGDLNPSLRGYGGAVFADRASAPDDATGGTIRISDSEFKNNEARGEGGAAYLYTDPKDQVSVKNSSFKNNKVLELPGGNGGNGGALVQLTNGSNQGFTIDNTTFSDNTAASQGGALWMMGAPTTITDSTFSKNAAQSETYYGNGGAMALYGPTNIDSTTIANNDAGWVGGGIFANEDPVSIKDSILHRNTAENGPDDWNIQQQTNRELDDWGGNLQYPAGIDKATANITTTVDPQLGPLQASGIHSVGNPIAAGVGDTDSITLA